MQLLALFHVKTLTIMEYVSIVPACYLQIQNTWCPARIQFSCEVFYCTVESLNKLRTPCEWQLGGTEPIL